jgi:hypothetical protein
MKLVLTLALFFCSAACCIASPDAPLFAQSTGGYWYNFRKWWAELFGSQSGVVMIAMGVGAASLFIITRGKWLK